jgi:serine protease Do
MYALTGPLFSLLLFSGAVLAQPVPVDDPRETGNLFVSLARAVSPSVVSVRTEQDRGPSPEADSPLGEAWPFGQDLFERFFGEGMPEMPQPPKSRGPRAVVGQGSGFVFRVDAGPQARTVYVVTNNHVIEDATGIHVRLKDGREYAATLEGTDPQSDVAVLAFAADDVQALPIGDSAALQVGEWVLAIGNPFGLQHTLTVGVVSATGRSSLGISDYEDFIQTDAAINPGNSGGPLVNLDGAVVGMNTAIVSRSGGYMGVGFAIPANLLESVASQLIDQGEVVRGYLGIVIQQLTPNLARGFGLDLREGVVVAKVEPDSPAARAGLRQGDVIVGYAGKPVARVGDFRNRVALTEPGSERELVVWRDGEKERLTVEIGRLTPEVIAARQAPETAAKLGLTVQTLTPEIASQFGARPGEGVVVTAVEPDSVAARAGIDAGTVILQVDRQSVRGAEDFAAAVDASADDREVMLLVRKGAMQRYLVLRWR